MSIVTIIACVACGACNTISMSNAAKYFIRATAAATVPGFTHGIDANEELSESFVDAIREGKAQLIKSEDGVETVITTA